MATVDIRGASISSADPPIGTNPNPDLAWKAPVRIATTGSNITLSGLLTVDGVALAAGDRVLVKNQTDARANGLYNATTGAWTRTVDAANNSQFTQALQVAVAQGTLNGGSWWRVLTANPIVLDTSNLNFGEVRQFWVTPEDFGAKHDGVTDDTPAIQAALDAIKAAGGGTLCLPPANALYKTVAQLKYDLSAVASRFSGSLTILGSNPQGSGFLNTTFAGPLLQYTGSIAHDESYLRLERIYFRGGSVSGSEGININIGAWITFDRVLIELFDIGFEATDVDQFAAYNTNVRFNSRGIKINPSAGVTDPNTWMFVNCLVAGNTLWGIQGTGCNSFNYIGGSIQLNGSIGGGVGQWGVKLIEAGADSGYGTVLFSGTAFEGNGGAGDFVSSQSLAIVSVTFQSVGFERSGLGYGTNNLSLTGSTACTYALQGCPFRGIAGYVPDAGRPVISKTNAAARVDYTGVNYFQNALEAPTTTTSYFGTSGSQTGQLILAGATSGAITVQPNDAAGTWTLKLPGDGGVNGYFLQTDGSGATTWAAIGGAGAGTVNSGTAGQMAYYATSTTAVSGNANATISAGALTLGQAGSVLGSVALAGSSSGTTKLQPAVAASGILTLPAATDTLIGKATTDILTNKTFDTAATGNVFKVNGTTISDKTGTGKAVLDTSPTLTTPTLGVATATSYNKTAITAPATGSTLAIADGKTLTANNTLTLAGTDSTTMTFPAASDTVAGLGTAQTFTKQNIFNVASTVAAASATTLDDIKVAASITTVTGTTGITTAAGFNKVGIYRPTITDSSVVTITAAATLYIENAPLAGGSVIITNPLSLWVGSGLTLLGGGAQLGGGSLTAVAGPTIPLVAHAGTDHNFYVGGNVSLADGCAFGAINDANNAFKGMEFRASLVMCGSSGFCVGTTTDPGAGGINANTAIGIGTTTLSTSFLALAAGTTAKSQINFAGSTAPTSPNNGDFWFDGTNFKARVSGATKTFTIS